MRLIAQSTHGNPLTQWIHSMVVAALVLVFAAGCGSGDHTHIDFGDFVRYGGIVYAARHPAVGHALPATELGPLYFTVKRSLQDSQQTPDSSGPAEQDGDAGILPAGTPLYTVIGYAPTFRLATDRGSQVVVYEAETNPNARMGADLLDISGRVRDIRVLSPSNGTSVLATVSGIHEVNTLVTLVLTAPVRQFTQEQEMERYFVAFDLRDGTAVVRAYYHDTGQLDMGIMTPAQFGAALDAAVQAALATTQPTQTSAP